MERIAVFTSTKRFGLKRFKGFSFDRPGIVRGGFLGAKNEFDHNDSRTVFSYSMGFAWNQQSRRFCFAPETPAKNFKDSRARLR
jgi:hypothetical protein